VTGIRHAVILAAGRGRRLMPLTSDRPKAMVSYAGATLIEHGIDQMRRQVENVHITVGYKGAMLADHVIHHGVRSVFNTDGKSNSWWIFGTLLGTLDEPVLVLTCDNVVELDFERLEEDYRLAGEPACMLVPVSPVEQLEGDWIFHEERVVSRVSRTEPSDSYCSGIQILNPARVRSLTSGAGDFTTVWAELAAQRELRCSRLYPKQWFAVDTPGHLESLQAASESRPNSSEITS
jgi:N-acetyl-alpha-D-muramate 1-phosphate uridylyltransferase